MQLQTICLSHAVSAYPTHLPTTHAPLHTQTQATCVKASSRGKDIRNSTAAAAAARAMMMSNITAADAIRADAGGDAAAGDARRRLL